MNTMKTMALLSLLLLAGCGGGGFTSERPSEKDLKTSLATFTPSYWNIGKFKTEAYENLGTKTLPKIATRFKSEARVNRDLFIIANAPSDIPKEYLNDAVFLKPTVKDGETREVFGVALSERVGDSWKTDFGLESTNLEDFGKPKSSYERPGSLTVVIGSDDEIALRDSIEVEKARIADLENFILQFLVGKPYFRSVITDDDSKIIHNVQIQILNLDNLSKSFSYLTYWKNNHITSGRGSIHDGGVFMEDEQTIFNTGVWDPIDKYHLSYNKGANILEGNKSVRGRNDGTIQINLDLEKELQKKWATMKKMTVSFLSSGKEVSGNVYYRIPPSPFNLLIDSFDNDKGDFSGKMTWPADGSITKVEGKLYGLSIVFQETMFIKKGGWKPGDKYNIKIIDNDEAKGTHTSGRGKYNQVIINLKGRGILGVWIQNITPDLAKSFNIRSKEGILVSDVLAGSAAEKAGIKRGDVIIKFDGRTIKTWEELPTIVQQRGSGSKVAVILIRDGQKKELSVTLD